MTLDEPSIRLESGETAIVGYGSLLSVKSLEKTLARAYDGPFLPCRVDGWRRSWDIAMPNRTFFFVERGERVYPEHILYLNVRPEAGSSVNGVVFVVRPDELEAMHQREWIYDHPPVTGRLRVATKYVQTTRAWFADQGRQVEIIRLYGSMELAPVLGLAH